MWLPNTKTNLVNEIYYLLQGTYTRYEIERVYLMELDKIPARVKYYSKKAWIKKLQAWLIQVRIDVKKTDCDIKKLEYNITTK